MKKYSVITVVSIFVQIYFHSALSLESRLPEIKCPCKTSKLCQPITDTRKKEVFAFSVANNEAVWSKYDWSKLTTVVSFGYINDSLTCLAHSHNTRVVYLAGLDVNFTDPSARQIWVAKQLVIVEQHFLDGINFDYESVVNKSDETLRDGYTSLVSETNAAFKKKFPHSQISVDVGWAPNADVRFYDYPGLANGSDFLFVMAYSEQSQIHGECLALPNSGYLQTMAGLKMYQNPPYSIRPEKLVLGIPWMGLVYTCLNMEKNKCFIKPVPFRGVNCSDAGAKGLSYGQIYNLVKTMPDFVNWNSSSLTPYISYSTLFAKYNYQVQYDDPKSLSLKYKMAEETNTKGVGMWHVDALDYSDTEQGRHTREVMFGALPNYK